MRRGDLGAASCDPLGDSTTIRFVTLGGHRCRQFVGRDHGRTLVVSHGLLCYLRGA